jgi:hypothetical protein
MDWWQSQSRDLQTAFEVWLVEVSETPTNWILSAIKQTNFRYIHCPCKGTFHKTRALNLALAASRGDYVVPYDIDLLPVKETLKRHLFIAEQSHQLLITGYRLMSDCETVTVDQMPSALESGTTAPEDQPTALWKHLIRHEKFGVVPFLIAFVCLESAVGTRTLWVGEAKIKTLSRDIYNQIMLFVDVPSCFTFIYCTLLTQAGQNGNLLNRIELIITTRDNKNLWQK